MWFTPKVFVNPKYITSNFSIFFCFAAVTVRSKIKQIKTYDKLSLSTKKETLDLISSIDNNKATRINNIPVNILKLTK